VRPIPTAPLAAGSLIAGWGAVAASGSRTLGGVVLALGGACCVAVWRRRHGWRLAARLLAVGFAAFVVSHVLGLLIGAWPAVLLVASVGGAVVWACADSRLAGARTPGVALREPLR
jgi:hypothetical protein